MHGVGARGRPGLLRIGLGVALGLCNGLRAGLRSAHVRHDRVEDLGQVVPQLVFAHAGSHLLGAGELHRLLHDGFRVGLYEISQSAVHVLSPRGHTRNPMTAGGRIARPRTS